MPGELFSPSGPRHNFDHGRSFVYNFRTSQNAVPTYVMSPAKDSTLTEGLSMQRNLEDMEKHFMDGMKSSISDGLHPWIAIQLMARNDSTNSKCKTYNPPLAIAGEQSTGFSKHVGEAHEEDYRFLMRVYAGPLPSTCCRFPRPRPRWSPPPQLLKPALPPPYQVYTAQRPSSLPRQIQSV